MRAEVRGGAPPVTGPPPPPPPHYYASASASAAHGSPSACRCCCRAGAASRTAGSGRHAARGRRGRGGAAASWCCCCVVTAAPTAAATPVAASAAGATSALTSAAICVLVLGYTLLGAVTFMALEGGLSSPQQPPQPPASPSKHAAGVDDDIRSRTVEKLWSITEDLNILYKDNWTRLAAQEVLKFQDTLVRNLRGGGVLRPGGGGGGAAGGGAYGYGYGGHHHRWSFSSSFLYSLTLITTIGYGSVSPRTPWGKVVTIVYALVGIPLMLVYLSTVGDVLARSFRRLYGRLCGLGGGGGGGAAGVGVGVDYPHKAVNSIAADGKLLYPHHRHSADSDDFCKSVVLDCGGEGIAAGASPLEAPLPPPQPAPAPAARVPVSLCLCIVVAYVCAGALLFNRLENWTFLEGSFFCFTSLGTIGFGDLVPGGLDGTAHQQLSVIASSAYILVGMALVAMCFNLVQPHLVEYFVPRSVSEFNLAGVVPPPPQHAAALAAPATPTPAPRPSSAASVLRGSSTSASRGCEARSREKMVTFEDDPTVTPARKALALEDVFM
ncbi:uncharacterized protein LOC126267939 [Schistocerca gregaria]|uniref:uncharacterized protein LOC126267939 n=1 Tax=Schistocerca gregaria TaxID=7010 RepID=UPI00211E907E|nr:uncharacterized protein LOC126267939 [Schistocerca gregaria]